MKRHDHPQRSVTLPPLNLARMDSSRVDGDKSHDSETALYFQRAANTRQPSSKVLQPIIEASQTVLFTATSLQRTLNRCISCTGNDSLQAAFTHTLYKSRASTERLMHVLDLVEKRRTPDICQELIQATVQSIHVLKELCGTIRIRLSTLVQGLDTKFSRHLLMHLYSATIDMKEAWEVIRPHLNSEGVNVTRSPRTRPSESPSANSPLMSPFASPGGVLASSGDNTQLYTQLRNAVTGSLHVLDTLSQSIEETVKEGGISASLEKKLIALARQAQQAKDLCQRLDRNIESNMGSNKEDLLLLPTRTESSRRMWEDTSIYLKAIVSIMTFIRSISTEEDFVWPKSVKQGCLYVTRMTAEVAKLWNSCSTFAEDGFFLGRHERSASVSEQTNLVLSTSPAADTLFPENIGALLKKN